MSERKFRADKLYKLFKTLVIITSLISLLLALLLWANTDKINKDFSVCLSTHTDKPYNYCSLGGDVLEQGYGNSINLFITAIFLPILFFGGTWLYKYLFPKININK